MDPLERDCPLAAGLDRALDPDDAGLDRELDPDDAGLDRELDPDDAGLDRELDPDDAGLDRELDPDDAGLDRELDARLERELDPDDAGLDLEPEPDDAGLDREPEPDDAALDREPEPDDAGLDPEPDPDFGFALPVVLLVDALFGVALRWDSLPPARRLRVPPLDADDPPSPPEDDRPLDDARLDAPRSVSADITTSLSEIGIYSAVRYDLATTEAATTEAQRVKKFPLLYPNFSLATHS